MSSSDAEIRVAMATSVRVTEASLVVDLVDGRIISVPLAWYPRLTHGTVDECAEFRLIGHGEGIHWPRLDEDINVEDLLVGRPSGESQASLDRWLRDRRS